jgi:uncharacterized protein (TIGR02118 family)
MFHVVFLVKKADRLSREEFADYWINEHTPLTAAVPGVRSYRCYVATGADGGEPAYDGVAVLTFDDEASYRRALAGPEFTAALGDAPNFQNVAQTTSLFASEHVIV